MFYLDTCKYKVVRLLSDDLIYIGRLSLIGSDRLARFGGGVHGCHNRCWGINATGGVCACISGKALSTQLYLVTLTVYVEI